MKSPVNKILRQEFYFRLPRDGWDLLLYSGGMTLVYKETLAGGHVPLPDGGVRPARDDVGVLHRHAVDVTGVAPGKDRYSPLPIFIFYLLQHPQTLRLLSLGGPHTGRGVLAAGDQHAAVLRETHAVDALLVVRHRLQQLAFLSSSSGSSCPHVAVCCDCREL